MSRPIRRIENLNLRDVNQLIDLHDQIRTRYEQQQATQFLERTQRYERRQRRGPEPVYIEPDIFEINEEFNTQLERTMDIPFITLEDLMQRRTFLLPPEPIIISESDSEDNQDDTDTDLSIDTDTTDYDNESLPPTPPPPTPPPTPPRTHLSSCSSNDESDDHPEVNLPPSPQNIPFQWTCERTPVIHPNIPPPRHPLTGEPINHNLIQLRTPDSKNAFYLGIPEISKPYPPMDNFINKERPDLLYLHKKYKRSSGAKEDIYRDFLKNDIEYTPPIFDKHFLHAIDIVWRKTAPMLPLYTIHFCDTRNYPFKLSTSAEAPYTRDPSWARLIEEAHARGVTPDAKISFANLSPWIFQTGRLHAHQIKSGAINEWSIDQEAQMHVRRHLVLADEPDKLRTVYGYQKFGIIIEVMFLWDYARQIRQYGSRHTLWGYETRKHGHKRIWNQLYTGNRKNRYLGIDYSGFDRTVPFWLMEIAFEIIFSHFETWTQYFPTLLKEYSDTSSRAEDLFRLRQAIKYYCYHTKMCMYDGSLWQRIFAGLPSGMFGTNIIGTVVNMLVYVTTLLEMEMPSSAVAATNDNKEANCNDKFLGDDLAGRIPFLPAWCTSDLQFLDVYTQIVKERFGMIVHPTKSIITSDLSEIKILGYFNDHGIPRRPAEELYARLLFPERDTNKAKFKAQIIGMAYATNGYDQEAYDTLKQLYTFICTQSDAEPDFTSYNTWKMENVIGITDFKQKIDFPTIEQTLPQEPNHEEFRTACQHAFPSVDNGLGISPILVFESDKIVTHTHTNYRKHTTTTSWQTDRLGLQSNDWSVVNYFTYVSRQGSTRSHPYK
jgi:hypothetical protein